MATTKGSLTIPLGLLYWIVGAVVVVGALVLGITLLARSVAAPRPAFDAGRVSAAAKLASDHGQQMKELGGRMVENGRQRGDTFWITNGEHWVRDGDSMIQRGRIVQNVAAHVFPTDGQIGVDIRSIEGDALALKGHGQAMVEHAQVMKELAALIQQRAQATGDARLLQDAQDSLAQSAGMERAGQQILQSGDALSDWVGRAPGSMGR